MGLNNMILFSEIKHSEILHNVGIEFQGIVVSPKKWGKNHQNNSRMVSGCFFAHKWFIYNGVYYSK